MQTGRSTDGAHMFCNRCNRSHHRWSKHVLCFVLPGSLLLLIEASGKFRIYRQHEKLCLFSSVLILCAIPHKNKKISSLGRSSCFPDIASVQGQTMTHIKGELLLCSLKNLNMLGIDPCRASDILIIEFLPGNIISYDIVVFVKMCSHEDMIL